MLTGSQASSEPKSSSPWWYRWMSTNSKTMTIITDINIINVVLKCKKVDYCNYKKGNRGNWNLRLHIPTSDHMGWKSSTTVRMQNLFNFKNSSKDLVTTCKIYTKNLQKGTVQHLGLSPCKILNFPTLHVYVSN